MIIKYGFTTPELVEKSYNYFPKEYIQKLEEMGKGRESRVARYFLSQIAEKYFWKQDFLPEIDTYWKPIFTEGLYWSISHSWNLIFVWISEKKIALDCEIVVPREETLFETETTSFFEKYEKTWQNFYILWTAKETFIKYLHADFSLIDKIWFVDWKEGDIFLSYKTEIICIKTKLKTENNITFVLAYC